MRLLVRDVLLVFLFCIGGLSQAQDFKLGYLAGLTASQVDGDNLSGYNKIGPHLGIFVDRSLGTKFNMRAEFLFTIKGAKNYIDIDNITDPLKTAFYYIEVPFMLNYRIKKFQVEAGPSFGVLMYAFNNDKLGRYTTTSSYNRMDWEMNLGLSYILKQDLLVYSRFSYSLTCIDGVNCGKLFTAPKRRPGYFHNSVSLGIRKYFNAG